MKKIIVSLIFIAFFYNGRSQEKYGNTLNAGVGIGYYGYTAPAISLNYEIDVFKNFTLAPFISVLTYRDYRYWGDYGYAYRDYYYRETIIPIGVKGSYYFDDLLKASDKWDFYAAASLGVAFRTTHWENGYNGDRVITQSTTPLYGNLHIGTEWHASKKVGLFLDLSTGLSTIGLAFHL